jgi:GTPase
MREKRAARRSIDVSQESKERAYLVAVDSKNKTDSWSISASLEELTQLAATAGAEVLGRISQRLPFPSKTTYLGEGKLKELLAFKDTAGYNLIIVDDELTPLQQKSLEEALQVKIIDRVALILDIFARRARTKEGQLQVELAQLEYLYPRLAGQWSHLERLGGGIGTRGPGESQIETDRRIIQRKIQRLKLQIEQIRKHRELYRQRRKRTGIPIVALVGYTNTGKSTLLNALSKANVFAENKLFATLDPTTRRLTLPDKNTVLVTDTVGFIRKLPPTIVTAFRATLEEISEASVLIHVVDFSSPDAALQCQAVEEILAGMGLSDKLRITALNKIDLVLDKDRKWSEREALDYLSKQVAASPDTVLVSSTKRWGLVGLMEMIQFLTRSTTIMSNE